MKRILSVCLIVVLLLMMTACSKNEKDVEKNTEKNVTSKQDDEYIQKAIEQINESWEKFFSNSPEKTEEFVEIIDTRLIYVKDNDIERFKDVEAVVEFELFTDFFGSSPYYSNVQQRDTVTFFKDGEIEVGLDVFSLYRASTFNTDFSDIIEKIVEYGTAYNTNYIKKDKASESDEKYIKNAIKNIRSMWSDSYEEVEKRGISTNKTVKIINTKLMYVNEKSTYAHYEEYFNDVEAIVEFELHSDYYGSAPYFWNCNVNNTVVFHKDGTIEVRSNYMNSIRSRTFDSDFSDLFSEIVELGDFYNQTIAC